MELGIIGLFRLLQMLLVTSLLRCGTAWPSCTQRSLWTIGKSVPVERMQRWKYRDHRAFLKVPAPGDHPSISESFIRSSGPGGQNVNKVNTKVELRVDLNTADWLPEGVKERLKTQQANRINKEGELVLHMQEHRNQGKNRQAAFAKLEEVVGLASVVPKVRKMRTGLSKEAKERRLKEKKRRHQLKENRRKKFDLDY